MAGINSSPQWQIFSVKLIRGLAILLEKTADTLDALITARIESWVAVFSLSSLCFVFSLQFFEGLQPCELCIYQRLVHGGILGLSAMIMATTSCRFKRFFLLMGLDLILITSVAVAFFHVGVEQHWWSGQCSITLPSGGTPEEMIENLKKLSGPKCDEVLWRLFGLSMATWNAIASAFMALCVFICARKAFRSGKIARRMRFAVPQRIPLQ